MSSPLRERLKHVSSLKILYLGIKTLSNKHSIVAKISALQKYLRSYRQYRVLPKNNRFLLETADLYPRLFDDTSETHVDPVYFYQDAWCAKKIFQARPPHHVDVGSHLPTIGIISQFVPTTMVDIRPPAVTLPELSFTRGSILDLPFEDGSVPSLSSICVIEHIGLGRYGDTLNAYGSEEAIHELIRVLAVSGDLYISVPIDTENKVYFNAHRAFTRSYVLELFSSLALVEEKYVYGDTLSVTYDPARGFGTGLYHFKK